jgi:hypothetical protein
MPGVASTRERRNSLGDRASAAGEVTTVVSRRRLLVGSAAALGTLGLGAAATTAWASPRRTLSRQLLGGGMPLPDGTVVPVDYLSRPAWGAEPSWRNWPAGPEEWLPEHTAYQRVKYTRYPAVALAVHHTAGNSPSTPAAAAQEVRNIYYYEAVNRGWGDLGYNLLIDPFGIVYEGRYGGGQPWPVFGPAGGQESLMTTGAHILGYNAGNIGVCLLGNFDIPGATPTPAATQALITVLAGLGRFCGINPRGVVAYVNPVPVASDTDPDQAAIPERHNTRTVLGVSGHRDWAATGCPGGTFYPMLEQVRIEAAMLIDQSPRPPRRVPATPIVPEPPDRPTPSSTPLPPTSDRTRPPSASP